MEGVACVPRETWVWRVCPGKRGCGVCAQGNVGVACVPRETWVWRVCPGKRGCGVCAQGNVGVMCTVNTWDTHLSPSHTSLGGIQTDTLGEETSPVHNTDDKERGEGVGGGKMEEVGEEVSWRR